MVLPLTLVTGEPPAGLLVAGLSPRLVLDEAYRGFLDLAAARIGAGLAAAQARERERQRLERLAELDRAKTEFFQNISHEFRTPLTLLLAPLEEALLRSEELPRSLADELDVAARNARRLLTLVDTLLDFSQVEAGRLRAYFEQTDLAALTADLAGVFRSAVERAGLRLVVDCPPLPLPVWVDRAMWERVVSNLLSNALKHTFEGEIAVQLRALPQHAELVVRDTGVGIPAAELPHLFKRFHRVRGARARTHEGAGIGLALVDELVRQHHGRVRVKSKEGEGTTFTVWVPIGRRPGGERSVEREAPNGRAQVAAALAEEAAQWNTGTAAPVPDEVLEDPLGVPADFSLKARALGARVLVVDDNADLRDYLRRLLAPHWTVETAADGAQALEKARGTPPGLILADVMMPNLDGFGLLRAVREDEALRMTPVILVTARAGEETAIEGLLAGADDYLAKPFSARELVARVGAQLELARVRREAGEAIAQREERFRRALEIETVGVIFWGERLTITGANDAFLRMTGFSRDEALGKSWRDLTPPEHYPVSERVIAQLQATGVATPHEKQCYRKDGSRWWGLFAGHKLSENEIVEFVVDVTERRQTEAALRASESRLSALTASSSEVLYRMSPDWSEMRELSGGGFLGDTTSPSRAWLTDYIPPEDQALVTAAVNEAIRTRSSLAVEHRVRRVDGSVGWILSKAVPILGPDGEISEWFGAASDVTERREGGERQAFLLRLSDALRALDHPADVQAEAARVLGEQLGASRAAYFEIDGDECVIASDYARGVPSLTGRHPVELFGREALARHRKRRSSIVADIAEAHGEAERQRLSALQIGAYIVVPLAKEGRFIAGLTVHSATPRAWTAAEVALVEETAERTWAAVERARAEEALRECEPKSLPARRAHGLRSAQKTGARPPKTSGT